ncbi:hypothetical protein O181_059732 [Austropuccinia psidii MF-1]|uniref:Uncharacterized protein n=1 Tax=Austropuccinia psidii MF-1 TaxID=1389203 RepID=A0A9Q3HXP9_9BASI|nr:hypothetical protein [Austropuccinia psidii MF-1]
MESIEIYQSQYKIWYRESKEEEWEICPSLWQGAINSYLHIKSFLGQEKTIELLAGWRPLSYKDKVKKIYNLFKNQILLSVEQKKELEMTPDLEKEGPVVPTSSKPAPEVSKDKPKDLRRNREVPRTIKEREKEMPIGTDLTHKGTGSQNWSLKLCTVFSILPELLCNSQPKNRKG